MWSWGPTVEKTGQNPKKRQELWSWGPTVVMRKWVGEEAAKSGTHSTIRWAHNDTCEGTQQTKNTTTLVEEHKQQT